MRNGLNDIFDILNALNLDEVLLNKLRRAIISYSDSCVNDAIASQNLAIYPYIQEINELKLKLKS